jgi:hypothetical protein
LQSVRFTLADLFAAHGNASMLAQASIASTAAKRAYCQKL